MERTVNGVTLAAAPLALACLFGVSVPSALGADGLEPAPATEDQHGSFTKEVAVGRSRRGRLSPLTRPEGRVLT